MPLQLEIQYENCGQVRTGSVEVNTSQFNQQKFLETVGQAVIKVMGNAPGDADPALAINYVLKENQKPILDARNLLDIVNYLGNS